MNLGLLNVADLVHRDKDYPTIHAYPKTQYKAKPVGLSYIYIHNIVLTMLTDTVSNRKFVFNLNVGIEVFSVCCNLCPLTKVTFGWMQNFIV